MKKLTFVLITLLNNMSFSNIDNKNLKHFFFRPAQQSANSIYMINLLDVDNSSGIPIRVFGHKNKLYLSSNNKKYFVGDKINGFKIIKITLYYVVMKKSEKEYKFYVINYEKNKV